MKTYYILEMQRLMYIEDGKAKYETIRYAYATKKTALKFYGVARRIDTNRSIKLIKVIPNEIVRSDT